MTTSDLIDSYGRVHRDLRISLTDVCNLRCQYCLPADGVQWLPRDIVLSREEIVRIAAVTVAHGISEIRLTGGEPLLRRDLLEIVADLSQLEGVDGPVEVSMTTNGVGLARCAQALRDAGLARVNISLDSLDPTVFQQITRRDRLADVLAAVDACVAADLTPVKINSVLLRGVNDHEAADLVRWACSVGVELRFIEQMPLDAGHLWRRDEMVTADETFTRLSESFQLSVIPGRGAAPADRFLIDDGPHAVGIIASVTRPFCGACDRLRLTADGQLRNCLFSKNESDLRAVLRGGGSDDDLAAAMFGCLAQKMPGHGINQPGFLQPVRPMSAIGG